MASVVTTVTELPESRVRVQAEVPAEEVERRLHQTARALGREMRIPGFRKGKVPPPVVLGRVGRPAVLDETVRGSLGAWYVDAIDAAGIVPVGDPDVDLGDLPGEGQPLTFSIEIGVRPPARLGRYKGLEVGRREPEVAEEAIAAELERLRERLARLETVEEPAAEGSFVVIDSTGTVDGDPLEGGEVRDELVELGAGRLLEEMDRGLVGATAGETRTVEIPFPDDHPSESLRGRTGSFEITVKEVKRKELPELDDELAADAAGFDSLEELRADIRTRLEEADAREIESEFREAALDAVVAEASVDVPEALVEGRSRELWEQLSRTLERQGISRDSYLQISQKTEEQILEEARPDAERALRREAVLAAVIEAEGIEPGDEELLSALEHSAEHEKTTPQKLLARLRQAGGLENLRRDVAGRQAVELLAAKASPIPVDQAKAREKLWTPGKEDDGEGSEAAEGAGGKLWTPGS